MHNLQILRTRTTFKRRRLVLPYFKSRKGISQTSLRPGVPKTRFVVKIISYDLLNVRKQKITTNKLLTRTNFQRFLNKVPRSSFKNWSFQCHCYVVGRLYSVQYKSIFGAPDKVRRDTCDKARPLSQRYWAQHLIEIWGGSATTSSLNHPWDAGLHSHIGVRYWTDQTHQI